MSKVDTKPKIEEVVLLSCEQICNELNLIQRKRFTVNTLFSEVNLSLEDWKNLLITHNIID